MFRPLTVFALLLATAAPALAIPRPGDPAPPFSLATSDGKTVTLASLAGRAVYLNFFATWCGPCRVETPSIVSLSAKYSRAGVRVIGVDVGENAGKANAFLHDFHIPYTLAVDRDATTRVTYGGGLYFPLHVFIDKHGTVTTYHPGEMSASEIERALKGALR